MCNCILCTIGRGVYKPYGKGGLAPLKSVIAAIKAYDANLSPYPLVARDKKGMIAHLTKYEHKGLIHFSELEEFFAERYETARWQYPKAE